MLSQTVVVTKRLQINAFEFQGVGGIFILSHLFDAMRDGTVMLDVRARLASKDK